MSYNVKLCNESGSPLPTDHFVDGGTRNLYGDNECDLNITGNYWQIWQMLNWSPQDLHDTIGQESVQHLRRAFHALGGTTPGAPKPWKDYWAPTPGNALAVVIRLLSWAEEHPRGSWKVVG